MDSMEELVINASSTEDSQGSGRSASSFSWPSWNIMGGSNVKNSQEKKPKPKTPKKSSKRASFGTKNNKNIPTPTDEKFTVDRFQHDIEQAKLMRKASDKRKQQQKEQQQLRERKEPTEAEVRLGLDGLDEACCLQRMGRTKDALDISELSIELLIGYLKSNPSTIDIPSLSRNTIGVRIQNALTLAEEMKSELQGKGIIRLSKQRPQPLKTIVDTITHKLDSANEDKIPSSTRKTQPTTTKTKKNTTCKQINGGRMPAKNKSGTSTSTSTSTRKSSLNRKMVAAPAKTSVNRNTVAAPSPFANSQDPLVKTIKSDLYIDPSNLHSTTWKDIAGLNDAKQALQEAAILPLMRPDLFSGLRRPRNILLYGPPGTGKTLLVKAVAHESSCVLFVCTASAMTSKWHGEGEKLLRTLFQVARAAAPSIVFVDEMDALLSSRKSNGEHEASRRFKTEFMTNMDGIVKNDGDDNEKHLLVIAATNCPWDIDSAVLRRFPRRIYVPLPDQTTRIALLQNLLEKAGDTKMSKADVKAVVKRLDGFSGSDIASIAAEASFGPIRSLGGIDAIQAASSSDIRAIQRQDFDKAIDQATKSVSKTLLKQYDQWKQDQAAS